MPSELKQSRTYHHRQTVLVRRYARALRESCPLGRSVKIRLWHTEDSAWGGRASRITEGGRLHSYQIDISRELCLQAVLDVLIHEWAHLLTWHMTKDCRNEHPAAWGVAYAKAYRVTDAARLDMVAKGLPGI